MNTLETKEKLKSLNKEIKSFSKEIDIEKKQVKILELKKTTVTKIKVQWMGSTSEWRVQRKEAVN